MQRPGLFHICLILLLTCHVLATPLDYSNPKSQVEYISVQAGGEKPNFVPITRPPLLNQTPPPPPANSKNFAYNPASETWTQLGPRAPKPAEDTLVWNQSNDKWLTNVAGS